MTGIVQKLIEEKISLALYKIDGAKYKIDNFQVSTPNSKIGVHYATNILFLNQNIDKEAFKKALLQDEDVKSVDYVGQYTNLVMEKRYFVKIMNILMTQNMTPIISNREKVIVEYCSINPTGYLHIGHARSSVLGDSIARLLEFVNYDVTKEFYINDGGNQINLLARSIFHYYELRFDRVYPFPDDGYKGEEIKQIAEMIEPGNDLQYIQKFAMQYFLNVMKKDLNDLKIFHTSWISESQIIKDGYVDRVFSMLADHIESGVRDKKMASKGTVSGKEILLLKTKTWGDDEDRPLTRADGSLTYFAPDIAYHLNKIERAHKLVCTLGADHDSYSTRLKIALKMLAAKLKIDVQCDIETCQMVSFVANNERQKFSKRAGTAIRLAELLEHVNPDIVRFIMLSKNPGTPLIFDFEEAVNTSMKNPLFYILYAYVRACSVLREADSLEDGGEDGACEIEEFQILIILMSEFDTLVIKAVQTLNLQLITTYLKKLAEAFHKIWEAGRRDPWKRFLNYGQCVETADSKEPANERINVSVKLINGDGLINRLSIARKFKDTVRPLLEVLGIEPIERL